MPDNGRTEAVMGRHHMLETFIARLIPETGRPLWDHAVYSTGIAKEILGAPFKQVQYAKAQLATWLAWQDEPGISKHLAEEQNLFRTDHTLRIEFVRWFRELFDIPVPTTVSTASTTPPTG